MKELMELATNPLVWKLLIGYWAFSAIAGALPSPDEVLRVKPNVNPFTLLAYKFAFSAIHGLSGNLSRAAIAFKLPGSEQK